jgi:hypothetical protein
MSLNKPVHLLGLLFVQFGRGGTYIGANFDASFTIMSVLAISTYVLHTTDYYRVYGLAKRMLYSYPFLPGSFRFPLPSSLYVHQL